MFKGLRTPSCFGKHSHLGVHLALYLRALAGGTAGVENDLGVLTGVDYEADNPSGVPEHRSAQQRLVKVDGVFSFGREDGGGEFVHVVIWLLAVDGERVLWVRARSGVTKMGQFRASISRLEICLSIQVFRLHEGHIFLLGSRADDDVCGDRFVVVNLDEISNFDIFPSALAPPRVVLVLSPAEKAAAVVLLLKMFGTFGGIIVLVTVVVGLFNIFLIGDGL